MQTISFHTDVPRRNRAFLADCRIRGDKQFASNRHFKLSPDGGTCTFTMPQGGRVKGQRMARRSVVLQLPAMTGNAGDVLRQAAALAAGKKINITFRLDDKKLHVTVDPRDLPDRPERRKPARRLRSRAVGIDLNPAWIGIAAVENFGDPARLDRTKLKEWALLEMPTKPGLSRESVTEMLAAVCDRVIRLARKVGAATIAVEDGLSDLRSCGPARPVNRVLNHWAHNRLAAMLRRRVNLADITVVEVRGAYSTTIGNLAFEAAGACASAAETAQRGIATRAELKDVLPVFDAGWRAYLRKDLPLAAEAECWEDVHRAIKAAKLAARIRRFAFRVPSRPTQACAATSRKMAAR